MTWRRRTETGDWRTDFSLGAFLTGWRNVHRRWHGRSIFWAVGVAVLVLVVLTVAGGLIVALLGD